MLDSIYHMTLKFFCHYVRNVVLHIIAFLKICTPLLLRGVISLPDATSYDNIQCVQKETESVHNV